MVIEGLLTLTQVCFYFQIDFLFVPEEHLVLYVCMRFERLLVLSSFDIIMVQGSCQDSYLYVVSVFLVFGAYSAWFDLVFFAPFLPCFGAFADHFPVWVLVIFPGFWWGVWCWVDDCAAACWSVVILVAVVLVGVVVVVPLEDFGAVHTCWLYCVVFMFGHCVVILH